MAAVTRLVVVKILAKPRAVAKILAKPAVVVKILVLVKSAARRSAAAFPCWTASSAVTAKRRIAANRLAVVKMLAKPAVAAKILAKPAVVAKFPHVAVKPLPRPLLTHRPKLMTKVKLDRLP